MGSWLSGLGGGLQNRSHRFNSGTTLQIWRHGVLVCARIPVKDEVGVQLSVSPPQALFDYWLSPKPFKLE